MQELSFIYTAKRLDSSTCLLHWEQFLNLKRSYNIPLSEIMIQQFYDNLLGMYVAVHYESRVHGQSGSTVPRFPGSGILVPCRHGQIFVAAQVWHGMSQTLVPGAFF